MDTHTTDTHAPSGASRYLDKTNPEIWKALNGTAVKVRAATDAAGLTRDLLELVNVRVSQLNGCAFCLDLHGRLAAEAGVSAQRLNVLAQWRRTSLFSELERAALSLAEAVTLLPGEEELTAELDAARTVLTEAQQAALSWAAITMNAFNRVSMISGHPIRPARPRAGTGAGSGSGSGSKVPAEAGVTP